MPGATIRDCLAAVGAAPADLEDCVGLNEEWSSIKKAYFKKVLVVHPDKGGSAAVFRDVQAAFEVLRKLFSEAPFRSFAGALDQSTADVYKGSKDDLKGKSSPSWEYYDEAAKEVAATYRVELAKSARSRCQAKGSKKTCDKDPPFIEKGDLRVGFMMGTGTYGLWTHLTCWRVPSRVWLGLPDPDRCQNRPQFEDALFRMNEVLLSGLPELSQNDRTSVVRYVMNKSHWSFGGVTEKVRRRPDASVDGPGAKQVSGAVAGSEQLVAVPKQKLSFAIPVPGRGAPEGSLAGKTCVVTGVFPEIGGGEGMSLGKARTKAMLVSFGAKVVAAMSGKTDILVVGKDPGFSKVGKARRNPKTVLLSLHDLKVGLEQGSLEGVRETVLKVDNFATGFGFRRGGPNSLAKTASAEDLAIASGTAPAPLTSGLAAAAKKRPAAALRAPLKRPAAAPKRAAAKKQRR